MHIPAASAAAAEPLPAVANLGVRPTVNGTYPLLEVHVLDFSQQVYGRQVQVEFVRQLRDERRFDNLEALRAQIDLDVRAARTVFDDIRQIPAPQNSEQNLHD